VWGYNGYCRLGLGNQVDVLKPETVPQYRGSPLLLCYCHHGLTPLDKFAGLNESMTGALIAAGPTRSVVVDKQGIYWEVERIAVKVHEHRPFSETEIGTVPLTPHSAYRLLRLTILDVPLIMGCKISLARSGGVTHWARLRFTVPLSLEDFDRNSFHDSYRITAAMAFQKQA